MGALDGIKVVDLTTMVSGPAAAMMLADQGAEVIKVEPLHGEQMRFLGPPINGLPPTFSSCNRGKQSIARGWSHIPTNLVSLHCAHRVEVPEC